MLVVRFGCRQPWCVTLFPAIAAPPAHPLAVKLKLLCVRKHRSLVLETRFLWPVSLTLNLTLFIAASCCSAVPLLLAAAWLASLLWLLLWR